MALACQLFYDADHSVEAVALAEEGIRTARRIGEPELRRWAVRTASLSLWRSEHVQLRAELAAEELAAAVQIGDVDAEALALTTTAGIALELGDPDAYRQAADRARWLARRRSLGYLRIALGCVELTLADARGASEAVTQWHAELIELAGQTAIANHETFVLSLDFLAHIWDPDGPVAFVEQALPVMLATGDPMISDTVCLAVTRIGRFDQLHELVERVALPPLVDNWSATLDAAFRAEIACALAAADLAAPAVAVLQRFSGRMATSGVSAVVGPVDGYLALAQATVGNRAAATAAADRATAQAREWGMGRYRQWLDRHRSRLGI